MALPFIFMLTVLFQLMVVKGATITSQSDKPISFDAGDKILMQWTYQIKSFENFLSLECGKFNKSLPQRDQLKVLVTLDEQGSITVQQPTFANAQASLKNEKLSLTLTKTKDEAAGFYRCKLLVYDETSSSIQTVQSSLVRLIAQDKEAIAASQAREKEEKERNIIIIGISVALVGLIVIIVVIVILIKRRNSKRGQSNMVGNLKQKKNRKKKSNSKRKLTKDDIQTDNQDGSNAPLYSQNEEPTSTNEKKIEIVSTPEGALQRPYYDDEDLKDYV
ncbi:uncharacterized protein [Clytia hemisphaerica]